MQLREYQQRAVDKTIKYVDKYKGPGLIVAPTGSGKSLIVSALSHELDKVLVFQPNVDLLRQNYEKYQWYDNNATIFSAGAGKKDLGEVTFSTIGTANNAVSLFKDYNYLIVDEAHLYPSKDSMFANFIAHNSQLKIIGLTATPFRLKRYMAGSKLIMMHSTTNIWKHYIDVTQIAEVAPKYWSPIEYISQVGDTSILKTNSQGSEYTDWSLQMYAETLEDKVIELVKEYTGTPMMVFTPSVEQAFRLSRLCPSAAYVHGGTPKKERVELVANFKAGKINTMFNVNIFGIGFDYPELELVIDVQPTLSLARYYQRVGRICRAHPNKQNSGYIDLSGNYERFGAIEDLEFKPKGKGYQGYIGSKQITGVYLEGGEEEDTPAFVPKVMPWGKHKGKFFDELPRDYLEWMLRDCDMKTWMEVEVKKALAKQPNYLPR